MNTIHSSAQTEFPAASDRSLEADFPLEAAPFGRGDGVPPPRRSGWMPWLLGATLLVAFLGAAVLWSYLAADETAAKVVPVPEAPEAKRKELGKNVFLEVQGDKRRVIVKSRVCLREGLLEGLLCRKQLKEHEYILSADTDARLIHAALIAAGAKPGHPVQFQPRYVPASGTVIKVTLQYEKDGKRVSLPANQWIREGGKGNKIFEQDWVFGGSLFITDPDEKDKPPVYLANHGDVICLANMESAMLDVPFRSANPRSDEKERFFTAFTERIPPLETAVDVILEPAPAPEKKDKPGEK